MATWLPLPSAPPLPGGAEVEDSAISSSLLPPVHRPDTRRRELDRYPFSLHLATRWGDQDTLGHLNNVAIGGFYEEGRSAFLRDLGARDGISFGGVIAAMNIDYLELGFYPAAVRIGVGVASVGRSSIRFAQVLLQEGRCLGVAEAVMVCVDAHGAAQALPDSWRPLLERQLLDHDAEPAR